jgi:SAM-dependent methyltransferase
MFRAFFKANQRACAGLEPWLPTARGHTFRLYPERVARCLRPGTVRMVLDVGGGRTCAFAALRPPEWSGKIVAMDVAPEEIARNQSVDARIVADLTRGLPLADESVDLMASRSVLEHLANLESFVAEASRTMRPGGYFIHLAPCRFAPFAVMNRLIPNRVARKLLYFTNPNIKGICGFPAVYDRCTPAALRRLFTAHGFEIEECRPSYYQSQYYSFFLPFFLLSTAYELVIQALGWETLCAHVLIVARKRRPGSPGAPGA